MNRVFLLGLLLSLSLCAQEDGKKLAPYFPTPPVIVEKMLQTGALKKGEKMFDLGSGDGRIVIMAAQKFGADATGIELDEALYKQSSAAIDKLGLQKRARIVHGDVTRQDYSSADLITVYLLPDSIHGKIRPILEKQLKKGARVVSHDFEFCAKYSDSDSSKCADGWTPDKVINIEDDGEGRSHTVYLYLR